MRKAAAISGLAIAGLGSLPAAASTVSLTGTGQMTWTAQFLGTASPPDYAQTTPNASLNQGNNYSLSLPGQYTFLDQFGSKQTNVLPGSSSSSVGTYAFQDTYEFSISSAASGDLLSVSLNLGSGTQALYDISNLQFRLYEVPSNSTPGLSIPGGSTIVTPWTGTSGYSNGSAIQANFTDAQSGTYFLDIAGTADGSIGGTYVGQINLAPVPLPGAVWLMVSGLGLLGAGARRRRLAA